jgi:hypothetical protein
MYLVMYRATVSEVLSPGQKADMQFRAIVDTGTGVELLTNGTASDGVSMRSDSLAAGELAVGTDTVFFTQSATVVGLFNITALSGGEAKIDLQGLVQTGSNSVTVRVIGHAVRMSGTS